MRTNQINLTRLLPKLLAGIACMIALAASAQWQWLDKDGRKVYSDRAPPGDVLEKNIVKRPAGASKAAATVANAAPRVNADGSTAATTDDAQSAPVSPPQTAALTAAQTAASAPKLSQLDKELLEKKKQAADAEAAKRRADEERVARAKTENCALGKQAKASLDSGLRVARTNGKGEREILDDAARLAETQRVQSVIDASCK